MRNFNWSAPESNTPYVYSNEFGEVEFTPITDFMPVSEISCKKIKKISEVLFSVEQAEKVVLITENKRGQIAFVYPFTKEDKACYALQYSCRNRAAVCKVTIKEFQTNNDKTAKEQIEFMAIKTINSTNIW